MVELIPNGVYLKGGKTLVSDAAGMPSADEARENTIAYRILRARLSRPHRWLTISM